MKKSIYTKPKLCKAQRGWYVYIYYKGKQKRFSFGINRIKDVKEREQEFKSLMNVIHHKLKNGWNPFVEILSDNDEMLFSDALKFSLEKKKEYLASKSYSGYKGTVNFTIDAMKSLSLDFLEIKETKRAHIRTIMERAKKLNKWSNKSYNKNLSYLSAVMDELLEWDILEYNPVTKIRRLPEEESTANRTPTIEEHRVIKKELSLKHPFFYNFIKTEYHTGIRPKEILSITLNMIDLSNNEINLPPKITKSGTKKRTVIINTHLREMLLDLELSMYPQSFYLFGSHREKGKGNIGKHIDFIPGPTPIKRDTATKRWKRVVKDGLGIDVNMYSYKHKGGDDKLKAGVELDSIRNQYGHSESKMTERYVKEIKGVYKKDIIDNSPSF